jgi:hypothetical protein
MAAGMEVWNGRFDARATADFLCSFLFIAGPGGAGALDDPTCVRGRRRLRGGRLSDMADVALGA